MNEARHKQLTLHVRKSAAPDEAQLAKIRAFTLSDIPADELYVRTFVLAHNAIDRDKECFSESLLMDFVRTLPGKGLFIRHPMGWDGDTGPGEGRWFEAELVRMSHADARTLLRQPTLQFPPDHAEAVLLMASAYMVRGEDNRDLLRKVDAGIVSDVSVSFTAKDMERLKDDAGRELAAWRYLGPGEALEGSLVWLGAQPGARAIKHANNKLHQEKTVDVEELKKQLEQAESKAASATERADANQKAADTLTNLKSALGDQAVLLDDPKALKAAIEGFDAYRKSLIEDVVAAERRMGLVGDTPEAKAAAEQLHAGESVERLKALADHYGRSAPAPGLKGGDPNPSRPSGQKANGVFGNPLIAGAAAGAAN